MMPAQQGGVTLHINSINDSIDLLNLKEGEMSSINPSFGSLGDMDGFGLNGYYAFNDMFALFGSYERDRYDYASETLENQRIDLFLKYHALDVLTLDIGYKRNQGANFNITNEALLNNMLRRITGDRSVSIEENVIHTDKGDLVLEDDDGNAVYPHITVEDLYDDSFYVRLLTGFKPHESVVLDFYAGISQTTTHTKFGIYPNDNAKLQLAMAFYAPDLNLKYTEMNYRAGLNAGVTFLTSGFFELNYEFVYTDREASEDYIDKDHILKAYVGSKIGESFLVYLGGQAMYRQLSNEIPYLYNQYTQTTFDHKYGYIELGAGYRF